MPSVADMFSTTLKQPPAREVAKNRFYFANLTSIMSCSENQTSTPNNQEG